MSYIERLDAGHYAPSLYEKEDKHLLARSYVLYQKFERVYTPMDALEKATAFEELDKPDFCMKP